jgi:hypothetical protein
MREDMDMGVGMSVGVGGISISYLHPHPTVMSFYASANWLFVEEIAFCLLILVRGLFDKETQRILN